MDLQISQATAQGLRAYQEDRLVVEKIGAFGHLMAVFDGHGGPEAAEGAGEALGPVFQTALQRANADPRAVLRAAFRELHQLTAHCAAGSTASVVFIPESTDTAWAGVLGDSPVAVFSAQAWVAPEHNVRTNEAERRLAEARGGIVIEGYLEDPEAPGTGLQMTRSLGDKDMSRVLNREPEIHSVRLVPGSAGLVGSDGLLDPFGAAPAIQVRRLLDWVRQGADAKALVEDALRRQTGDNVSVIVFKAR